MKTKSRIIHTVLKVFNQHGYHVPTLADLAHTCKMSRGNFAYHFKFKQDLLVDIAEQMRDDINLLDQQRKSYPAFSNLTLDIEIFRQLQSKYGFIFRDMTVLSHEPIRRLMSEWSEQTIKRNMDSFSFAISVGTMRPEPYPGLYYNLAVNTWLIMYYWVSQHSVRKVDKSEAAEKMVWSTIVPHFTDRGIEMFSSYYGDDYLNNLGAPFKEFVDLKKLF